nr:replication initiator [Pseudofrankia sp. DC12]
MDLWYRRIAHQIGAPLTSGTRKDGTVRIGIRELVQLSYVKVAENQARCLIHYHGILRLDGYSSISGDYPEPPEWATGKLLAAAWRWAVERVREPCPTPTGAGLVDARWGPEHDEKHIGLAGGAELDPAAVANYLPKYVTKDLHESGALSRPIRTTGDLFGVLPFLNAHQAAMVKAAWDLGGRRHLAGLRLRANAHQYGYRGHWLTKSRRYSTTFGACRQERRDWIRTHDSAGNPRTPLDAWNRPLEDDTGDEVIALGSWRFEGAGYRLAGDAQLAAMAADMARSRREAARSERASARLDSGPGSAAKLPPGPPTPPTR